MKGIYVMIAILLIALVLPFGTSFVSASSLSELQYWKAGDQHIHTEYSNWDASYWGRIPPTVLQQAQAAKNAGLSWIIMTDHHTMMNAQDWMDEVVDCLAAEWSTGIKVMPGLEVGSCDILFSQGHYLAYGIGSYVNPPNNCQSMINTVKSAGGFGFIAHPYDAPDEWCDWGVTGYTGLEIMHAGTASANAINKWYDILKNPSARVVGIGNSDAHVPEEVGDTMTYCYLPGGVTTPDVYSALRFGRSVMSNGPLITFKIGDKEIGDTVTTAYSNAFLDVAWDAQPLPDQQSGVIQKIEVYSNESVLSNGILKPVKTITPSGTTTGSTSLMISVTSQTLYVRLRAIFSNGEAYTNPIWIVYTPPSGGGCPFLQVWNGNDYVDEGLLDIHNAEGVDVIYEHTLTTVPEPVNGAYAFRLIEHPKTISDIDQVQLRAILEDGTVKELPLKQAWHSEDGNVRNLLLKSDDRRVEEKGADHNEGTSQSIYLKFAALGPHAKAVAFIFTIEGNNMICKTCV